MFPRKEVRPDKNHRFPNVSAINGLFLGDVALGNGTQYRVGYFRTQRGIFIGVSGRGSYEFDHYVHWGYVMEKLSLKFEGDAMNLADFINDQLNSGSERQGQYSDHLLDHDGDTIQGEPRGRDE